jgi:hypothetical protein
VKVYLDNNIVSAIARGDIPTESDALDRLLKAWAKRKVDLVTSELTHAEIKGAPFAVTRTAIEKIYRLLEKVEIARFDELVGINVQINQHTLINTPRIDNDPDYSALLKLLKPADAQHVFVAAKKACKVFLTCDRGILYHARDIQKRFGLIVQRPSVFVASQAW